MKSENPKRKHRWINGTQGMISLLLAMLMLPFYTLAAVLIESQRYQSTVRAMDEVLGTASISVLSNYDSYLKSRFGLLAVSQSTSDNALSSTLLSYLNKTQLTDVAGIDVDSVSATGLYPLANLSVLRRQIEEYSKVTVAANLAINLSSIDSIVKELEKLCGFSGFFNIISAGASAAGSQADLVIAANELEDASKAVHRDDKVYDTKWAAWQDAVKALIAHLATTCPSAEEDEDGYNDWISTKESLTKEADKAKSEYSSAISTLISSLDTLEKKVDSVLQAQTKSQTQLAESMTTIASETYQGSHGEDSDAYKNRDKMAGAIESALQGGNSSITRDLSDALKTYDNSLIAAAITQLNKEKSALSGFSTSSLTGTSSGPDAATYHAAEIDSLADYDKLSELIEQSEDDVESSGLLETIKFLLNAIKSVCSCQTFFDPLLNCALDEEFYEENSGGLPSTKDRSLEENALAEASAEDKQRSIDYLKEIDPDFDSDDPFQTGNAAASILKKIIDDVKRLTKYGEKLKSFNKDWFSNLSKACEALTDLLGHLSDMVGQIGNVITNLATSIYEDILVKAYLIYNLPNRTNYRNGSALTGYKYANVALGEVPNSEYYEAPLTGSRLAALIGAISTGGGYPSKAFAGAELEYVLWGFNSEIANQLMQVFAIMVFRILADIQILANAEVAAAVAASTLAAPLVSCLFVVAEALCDVTVLVNGGNVPLIKVTPYVTPKGMDNLIKTLIKVPESLALIEKENNGSSSGSSGDGGSGDGSSSGSSGDGGSGGSSGDGSSGSSSSGTVGKSFFSKINFTDMTYAEHSLVLMILFGSSDLYLERFMDIIQTEASSYCELNAKVSQHVGAKAASTFDIDESYTVIRAAASGSLTQLLPIPSLSTNSLLTADRVIYRGY